MFALVTTPIDPRSLETVVSSGDGGVATFLGIVRGTGAGGKAVAALWYEAFEAMALREFEAIAREARDRYGDVRTAIVHRVGEVAVGQISVAVLAASAHRAPAFDACRYSIDALKARAPIWKQERFEDGTALWSAGA